MTVVLLKRPKSKLPKSKRPHHLCQKVGQKVPIKRPKFITGIVRPVKRDWAVLSKDTPVDISILKSVNQSVFIHL